MRVVITVLCLALTVGMAQAGELHGLVADGDTALVRLTIEKNASLLNELDDQHRTALYLAAENGNLAIAEILLNAGADQSIGDADNSQPVHLAAMGDFTDVVELLITNGADINAKDNNGTTPLIFAYSNWRTKTVMWLLEHGADHKVTNRSGEAPLHFAAESGSIDVARWLVEHGADLEQPNAYERTPLLLAARESGNTEIARLLADAGANINAIDRYNDTPLTLAAWRGFKPLVDFLVDRGASLPATDKLRIELISDAASYDLVSLFDALKDDGVDLSVQTVSGGSLMHDAAYGGSDSIITILLERSVDVNGRNRYGRTPLHYAAERGRVETAKLLISRRAEPNIRTTSGRTAFNIAKEFEYDSDPPAFAQLGVDTSEIQFPKLSGPYLGQELPGGEARLFAADIVSTNQSEHGCITFTPDGQEAYWTSSILPIDSTYTIGFIMTSKIENGQWTLPQFAEFSGIDSQDDIPVVSPDGTRLYFLSRTQVGGGMLYVEREGDGWSEPHRIQGGPNDARPYWQFSVTANHDIYFASGNGIFVSRYVNGAHSEPESIGPPIDTPYRESWPCVAPDERFLIYGTRGYPDSLGGDGLRISYKDSSGAWGPPELLKFPNTARRRICPVLSPDGKYLFYNSLGSGVTDIYWIETAKLLEESKQPELK